MKKRRARRKWERKVPGKGYNDIVKKNYERTEPKYDYFKYLRVVRHWAKRTHGVGLGDLEMLLFLYSERLFKRTDFNEYQQIFSWDVKRFQRLLKEGWVSKWRDSKGSEPALYEISYKGRRLITSFYKKLAGEEPVSEDATNNPMFKKNSLYTDKVYRRAIKDMNKSIKQQQRPSQE